MMNGTHIELEKYVERIFEEREKRWLAQFVAIEERMKRQVTAIGIAVGLTGGIIGALLEHLLK